VAMVVMVVFTAIEPFIKYNRILSWFGSMFAVIALIGILSSDHCRCSSFVRSKYDGLRVLDCFSHLQ